MLKNMYIYIYKNTFTYKTLCHIPNAWTHIHYSREQIDMHKQPQHLITSGKNIVEVWWEP